MIEGQTADTSKYINPESPFFKIYDRQTSSLDDLLYVPNLTAEAVPSFRQALGLYIAVSTGNSANGHGTSIISRLAGVDPKTGLFSHLLNDSGHEFMRGRTYPQTNLERWVKAAKKPTQGQIELIPGAERFKGRITLLLYDRTTGYLMLRGNGDCGVHLDSANGFIGQHKRGSSFVARYLRDLINWYSGARNEENSNGRIEVNKKTRFGSLSKKLNKLGLIPVYLLPPVSDDELKISDEKLLEHLRRISDIVGTTIHPEVNELVQSDLENDMNGGILVGSDSQETYGFC